MNKWLFVVILAAFLLALLKCSDASAEPAYGAQNEPVHFAEHFISSYAISFATYKLCTKVFKWDPIESFIFSAMLTLMVGTVYKISSDSADSHFNSALGKSTLYNGMGVAAVGATITLLEF